MGADQAEAFAGIDGILLLAAVAIVFVILLITYRSLQLAILFLFCGVGAVFTAQGVVYLMAKHADLTVNGQSAGILSVLVLGAGVDYALLLVARYREELHNYEDRHEAMAHALHRAAPAILASGATVIIGLLCLLFAQMNSTSSLGPVGAVGIACALLVMLVTLPALLVIVGRWIFWPFIPRYGDPIKSEKGVWARVGRRIARAPASGVGRHLAGAARAVVRHHPARRQRPHQRAELHQGAAVGRWPRSGWPSTSPVAPAPPWRSSPTVGRPMQSGLPSATSRASMVRPCRSRVRSAVPSPTSREH